MYALLPSRPRLLQASSVSVKGLASLQPFSQKPGSEVLPTDPAVKPFSDIPGPPSLPIIGNLLDYYRGVYDLKKPYDIYSMFRKQYGPLVKENLFYGKTLVHVFDQRDLQKVYLSDSGTNKFPTRHSHAAMKKYRESRKDLYDHVGVASSNGEEWFKYRNQFKYFNTMIMSQPTVQKGVEEIVDDFIDYIKSNLDHNGETPVFPTFYYCTLEVIGMLILGMRLGCFEQYPRADVTRLIEAVHDSHYAIYQTEHNPNILARKAYKTLEISQDYIAHFVLKRMDYIDELISRERKNADPFDKTPKSNDLVIYEDDEDPVKISDCFIYRYLKEGMSKRMILPMAVDFIQGGIHSTAHTLAFGFYHLAMNPDKQQILREEVVKNLQIGPKERPSLYPDQVRIEILRLNPPTIGTRRVLRKDLVLSGYHVPKGTKLILHHQVAMKSEDNYSEPWKFIPERHIVPFVYSPFAQNSRRSCLGFHIALSEMREVLTKIVLEFEISYHYEKVGIVNYMVNEPDKPFKLRLKEVSHSKHQQGSTTEGDKSQN